MFDGLSLNFRLFGIPIQLSLFFVIMAALLGRGDVRESPVAMVIWVVMVFVSVLLHEMGHAFTARAFGQQPSIAFHAMGGVTSWHPRGEIGPVRRLLIALAGPVAGLGFGVAVFIAGILFTQKDTPARDMALLVVTVNIFWGVFNLVPMIPLDGGTIMASVFDMVAPGRGGRAARYVSIVVALATGAWMVSFGAIIGGFLCALFVYINVQGLRTPPPPPSAAIIDIEAQPLPEEQGPPPPSPRLPPS